MVATVESARPVRPSNIVLADRLIGDIDDLVLGQEVPSELPNVLPDILSDASKLSVPIPTGLYNVLLSYRGYPIVSNDEFKRIASKSGWKSTYSYENGTVLAVPPNQAGENRTISEIRLIPLKDTNWRETIASNIDGITVDSYYDLYTSWQREREIIMSSDANPFNAQCVREVESVFKLARLKIAIHSKSKDPAKDIDRKIFDTQLDQAIDIYHEIEWMTKNQLLNFLSLPHETMNAFNNAASRLNKGFKNGGSREHLTAENKFDAYNTCILIPGNITAKLKILESEAQKYNITSDTLEEILFTNLNEVVNFESSDPLDGFMKLLASKLEASMMGKTKFMGIMLSNNGLNEAIQSNNERLGVRYARELQRRVDMNDDIENRLKRQNAGAKLVQVKEAQLRNVEKELENEQGWWAHRNLTKEKRNLIRELSVLRKQINAADSDKLTNSNVIGRIQTRLKEGSGLNEIGNRSVEQTVDQLLRVHKRKILSSIVVRRYIRANIQSHKPNPNLAVELAASGIPFLGIPELNRFKNVFQEPYEKYYRNANKYISLLKAQGKDDTHADLLENLPTAWEKLKKYTKYAAIDIAALSIALIYLGKNLTWKFIGKPLLKDVFGSERE
jgi:hypothetical protein